MLCKQRIVFRVLSPALLEPAEITEVWVFFLSAERAERKNQSALGAGFDSQYLVRHSGFHLPVLNPDRYSGAPQR